MIKIAITGPESSGKTSLAESLAAYYQCNWVPEYARTYLEQTEGNYDEEDLLAIAKGQLENERSIKASTGSRLLIADTEMTVIKIWSEFKYKRCHPWIIKQFNEQHYHAYLLTYPDISWEFDPLREHPGQGFELFDLYHEQLNKKGVNLHVIKGLMHERMQHSTGIINELLKNHG